jgi:hypothetical protein
MKVYKTNEVRNVALLVVPSQGKQPSRNPFFFMADLLTVADQLTTKTLYQTTVK